MKLPNCFPLNLKKISFSIFVLLILCTGTLSAQDEYLKDHVIVYFRDNVLNKSLLASDSRSFNRADLVTEKALTDSLDKWGTDRTFQKVVRNARPDKLTSTSRTGEEITIPMFYNLMYVPVPENEDALTLCKKLNELPFVIYAEPDYIMRSNDVPPPNDLYFNMQRGWEQANDRDIDLLRAWDFTRGSSNIRVGVLDGGIDYHNPDLGNGSYGSGYKVSGGYDYIDNDSNPDDIGNSSHGTAVAGVIGALSNNTTGVAGIAGGNGATGSMGVQLIALRVSQADGDFPIGKVVEGIYDAATSVSQGGFGCHILNYSAGGYNIYNSVRKAISYATHSGVIFIASKGNDESTEMHYPSDYADNLIISVGASDGLDRRAYFSNYGNDMDFVAPGTQDLLYTTKRVEQGSYGSFSGTSGAAPVVSGIAALLKSVNSSLHRDDVENIIQISCDRVGIIPYVNGYNDEMGHGRVNAGRALELLHAPYVLQHHTTTGGVSQKITSGDGEPLIFLNDAGTTLAEGWYFGQRYQVTKTVDIPIGCNERYVWPRTVGATLGWSGANPNNNLGYSHIVSETGTTVTLRTYVYYIKYNLLGQTINAWYPASPENAIIAYTTLINSPVTVTISGPYLVCSPQTFTLSSVPGATVTWNATPANLFSPSSGTGTTAIIGPAYAAARGTGTLTFTVTRACGSFNVTKPILVGGDEPVIYGIPPDPSTPLCAGTINGAFASPSADGYYHWVVYGGTIVTGQGTASLSYAIDQLIPPETSGSVGISLTVHGACGNPLTKGVSVLVSSCGGGGVITKVYPNPASDILTIEIDSRALGQTGILDIRLYDSQGRVLRQARVKEGKVQFNVAGLKDGIYYLHIYDDRSDKPEVRQIIVQH